MSKVVAELEAEIRSLNFDDKIGLVIEAPPEAASTLAALFSGMAQLLHAAATPATGKGPVRRVRPDA